ncbi:MAG: CO dehydrogenase/acetyl-CoA synthase complex subunit alpha [Nitrososphaerota archaeon]|uniref:CO dehydrogenase/acetyl-CoA synthase complex subunit alpha n=1 Tax=Candidatus Bathycorpusculum sp. TaxID=2994959 RepID=UPI0028308B7D|nr:CO dehydrogenase/acetyl-CoA synthase complex subunit alpha [Candidatus Termitimicrobium sp.]MCL2431137.1 CO dehydrogenase/acetyl-CoA synthase complex subunit alpha [Candidatus Termitimicrobium sp.]MDR0492934.1 CO dehydrogenase/acetyl-CoA synthase complex subunit alpha [Nitrososphaerota archaeon]
MTKNVHVKIDEMKTNAGLIKNLELSIGKVVNDNYTEPMGPTPMPSVTALRDWDMKLLTKYKAFYMPDCDSCCLCTFGKCDLTAGKRGACGIDIEAQSSRIVMIACAIGAACHSAHSRHLVHHLIEKYGRRFPLDIGGLNIKVEAPITRLVTGIKPETLGDLDEVLAYVEEQITQILAVAHTGQEASALDFESKAMHVGMCDHVGMEVGDIAQISALGYPKADPEAPLVKLGIGSVERSKPVIMCIGHNVVPSVGIIDYAKETKVDDKIEVVGLCCTSHDMTRYYNRARIVGPISWELRFIRAGLADVVVLDEQCIRTDVAEEAAKVNTPVIAASEKNCVGFKNRTNDDTNTIVEDLVSGKVKGVLILDPEKVGEVAVRVVQKVAPARKRMSALPTPEELVEIAKTCRQCKQCQRNCPQDFAIPPALKAAATGDISLLTDLYEVCIGCGRCESACPQKIKIHSLIVKAGEKTMYAEDNLCRVGRGAIQDTEIRNVGSPIVLGEIPGIVALVGCSNYPKGGKDVYDIAREFASRRYIVVLSGCSAMSAGSYRNEDGKTIWEEFPGGFEAGGVCNVGSCVSNSHIAGAAIKVANIFAKRSLRGNYEEIADYIHNRLGAVGLAWGAYSQKAAAIAAGFWRLGVPVVVGPHGSKYRRTLMGRKEDPKNWEVIDARTGETVNVGPTPEHLFAITETKEECIVEIAKLCMRPNDTWKGRSIKLSHYVDLSKRYLGVMPDDLHLFVRTMADVPSTLKDEFTKILAEKNWKETIIPDPTMLPRMVRKMKE